MSHPYYLYASILSLPHIAMTNRYRSSHPARAVVRATETCPRSLSSYLSFLTRGVVPSVLVDHVLVIESQLCSVEYVKLCCVPPATTSRQEIKGDSLAVPQSLVLVRLFLHFHGVAYRSLSWWKVPRCSCRKGRSPSLYRTS